MDLADPDTHRGQEQTAFLSPFLNYQQNEEAMSIEGGHEYHQGSTLTLPSLAAESPVTPHPPRVIRSALGTEPSPPQLGEEGLTMKELEESLPQEEEEDICDPSWARHEKHIFILSNSGKPIYARYGNENSLATLFGVMQALVAFVADEGGDSLRSITAGMHRYVFLTRDPLILVAVASTGEPESHLHLQLSYLYAQIISVLTYTQVQRIFEHRRNYDLRRLLGDTERFLDGLLTRMATDPCYMLDAVWCLPLTHTLRQAVGDIMLARRSKNVLFGVVVADGHLVALMRPKNHSLHPSDVHLINNLIAVTPSFRTQGEFWTPICLPRFNNKGFLHAHVACLDAQYNVCLLLFSTDKDMAVFSELSECHRGIKEELDKIKALDEINQSLAASRYTVGHMGIDHLVHFIYKSKATNQLTAPTHSYPYTDPALQTELFRQYQWAHGRMHTPSRPLKIYYSLSDRRSMLAWNTSGFELYACFGPLTTKREAVGSVNVLLQWLRHREATLFIGAPLVF